jgi:hypothetical protein
MTGSGGRRPPFQQAGTRGPAIEAALREALEFGQLRGSKRVASARPRRARRQARGGAGAKPRERFPQTCFRPKGTGGASPSSRADRSRGMVLPPRWGGHSLGPRFPRVSLPLHPGIPPPPPLAGLLPPDQMAKLESGASRRPLARYFPTAFLRASALSVVSQVRSLSSLPK